MIIAYEDEGFAGLQPLAELRPVFDLRCGRFTLLEKLQRLYPRETVSAWVRASHAPLAAEVHPGLKVNVPFRPPALFISARAILQERIPVQGPDATFVQDQRVVGFRLNSGRAWRPGCLGRLQLDLPEATARARMVTHLWDLVEFNPSELERECALARRAGASRRSQTLKGVHVIGPHERLSVHKSARIWPGTVISTETGPVFIDEGAQVRPGSFIEGPCYVGAGTVIDGARVRPGCSFGPGCRVGGEVEASVFQGYSNKHHDGFIGHSFVGEWVNLGALTTNSDLRNDYSNVKVHRGGKPHDTGLLKVGCFIADHAKTAIGTLLNTGAVVGTGANWFEPGLSPKEIPAFARGARERLTLEDARTAAVRMMSRRGRAPGPAYLALFSALYEGTKPRD